MWFRKISKKKTCEVEKLKQNRKHGSANRTDKISYDDKCTIYEFDCLVPAS